jgi:hypothetical protein
MYNSSWYTRKSLFYASYKAGFVINPFGQTSELTNKESPTPNFNKTFETGYRIHAEVYGFNYKAIWVQ